MSELIKTTGDEEDKMYDFLACHFGKGQGKIALNHLKDIFMDQVVADPSKEASFAYFAEGQRSVIMAMFANIESYNNEHKE